MIEQVKRWQRRQEKEPGMVGGLVRLARRLRRGGAGADTACHYAGDYVSWAEARAAAGGYDAPAILEKTVAAARAVRDGRAAWERDTILFHEPQAQQPLLDLLVEAAREDGGRLSVLDFGGALGSTYFQHRRWLELAAPRHLRWCVVEQGDWVRAGQREFTVGALCFRETINACFAEERPTVILLSSVLPYLENPRALLAEIADRDCPRLLIDRTGFTKTGRDRLVLQTVPPEIYTASYPCWFLDRASLLAPLAARWMVTSEWDNADGETDWFAYRGLMLRQVARRAAVSSVSYDASSEKMVSAPAV